MKRMLISTLLVIIFILIMVCVSNADVKAASGWSVASDETAAIDEAATSVKKGTPEPALVVMYCTSGYDQNKILKELSSQFPKSRILGANSQFSVFTEKGLHKGKKASLAILGLQTNDYIIGEAVADLSQVVVDKGISALAIEKNKVEQTKAMAIKCIKDAIADAGMSTNDKPSVVLLSIASGVEQYVTEAINNVFGKDVNVMGGTTATDTWGSGAVMSKSGVVKTGIAVVLIYTKDKIGTAFHGGFIAQKNSGIATDVDTLHNILYKIDGKPAFDVYNTWGNGFLGDRPTTDNLSIVKTTNTKPLGVVYRDKDGEQQFVIVIPVSANKDGSLIVAAPIHQQDRVMLVSGGAINLVYRTGSTARKAMIRGGIKKAEVAGGLHIYCAGAAYIGIGGNLGEDKIADIISPINEALDGAPFIGAFSGGEQGNYKGCGAFHGNFMSAMTLFGVK